MDTETLEAAIKLNSDLEATLRVLKQWEEWNIEDNFISIDAYLSIDKYSSPAQGVTKEDFDELKAKVVTRLEREVWDIKEQIENL